MENNILFENVKSGDKFLTRDGNVAIYLRTLDEEESKQDMNVAHHLYYIIKKNNYELHQCTDSGHAVVDLIDTGDDIVSKKQLSDKELDRLAWYEAFKKYDIHSENIEIIHHRDGFVEGFRVCYNKSFD